MAIGGEKISSVGAASAVMMCLCRRLLGWMRQLGAQLILVKIRDHRFVASAERKLLSFAGVRSFG